MTKHTVIAPRLEKLAKNIAKKINPAAESITATDGTAHPKPRRTTTTQPVRKTTRPLVPEKEKVARPQPVKTSSAKTPTPSNIPPKTVRQVKPASEPHPAMTHSQMARIPRKVKAHQANLEDAAMQKDNRKMPSRPSRRRYSPMPPSPEGQQ